MDDSDLSQMKLRGYEPGDLDAMFQLDELCFAPPFRFSRAAMRRFSEASHAHVVIAEFGTQLAGFCVVHVEKHGSERLGYVVTLDVAPEHRRKGVAAILMRSAEAKARASGCSAMLLHAYTGNEGAIRFYEREGYAFVGTAKDFYGVGMDAFVYRKGIANSSAS